MWLLKKLQIMEVPENWLIFIDSVVSDQRIVMSVLGVLYMVFALWVWQSHFASVKSCLHQTLMSYADINFSNDSSVNINIISTKSDIFAAYYHGNEKKRMDEKNANVIPRRRSLLCTVWCTYQQVAVSSAFALLFMAEIWIVAFVCFPSWWQLLNLEQKLEAFPAMIFTAIKRVALSPNIGFTATGNLNDADFFGIFVRLLLEGWIVKGVHYTLFRSLFSAVLGHFLNPAYEEDLDEEFQILSRLELQKLSQAKMVVWNRLPHVLVASNAVTFLVWLGLRLIPGFSNPVVVFVVISNILMCLLECIASYKNNHSSSSIYLD
jgi:hypothetical protein